MIPISVCIITKNEAKDLEKCLISLNPYPFEIIVVDTGSTDNSKEVAKKYTDKVFDFVWCNDFSAARNFSISKASHNMILVLDTDEVVTKINLEELNRLIEENPTSIGLMERYDYFDTEGGLRRTQICHIDRLFNRKYYTYSGKIHECVVQKGKTVYQTYAAPITADHFGYLGTPEKLKEKSIRDIKLLLSEIEETPANPYLYFQVGQSYMVMRDEENALQYFEMAMNRNPNPLDDYTIVLIKNYGSCLLTAHREQEALSLLSYYENYQDNADYLCMVGMIYIQLNQPLKALPEFIKALTAPKFESPDSRNVIPSFYIGYIYEAFGQTEIAKEHYNKCGDYPLAQERLRYLS